MQESYPREPVASSHDRDQPPQTQMLSALTPWMPGN